MKKLTKSIASCNLNNRAIDFINKNAKELKLSKWEYIFYMIEDYTSKKEDVWDLKFYLESMLDKDYIKDQIIESEIDLQTELKYSKYDY